MAGQRRGLQGFAGRRWAARLGVPRPLYSLPHVGCFRECTKGALRRHFAEGNAGAQLAAELSWSWPVPARLAFLVDPAAAMADIHQILAQLQAEVQRLAASPQAGPVAASLGGLLILIVGFYALARGTRQEQTGTVYQGGVRRSTRCAAGNNSQRQARAARVPPAHPARPPAPAGSTSSRPRSRRRARRPRRPRAR